MIDALKAIAYTAAGVCLVYVALVVASAPFALAFRTLSWMVR